MKKKSELEWEKEVLRLETKIEALTKALETAQAHALKMQRGLDHVLAVLKSEGFDDTAILVAALKPSAVEAYDAKAERFRRETGHMAPGKDVPAAMGGASFEERQAAWDEWCRKSAAKETT